MCVFLLTPRATKKQTKKFASATFKKKKRFQQWCILLRIKSRQKQYRIRMYIISKFIYFHVKWHLKYLNCTAKFRIILYFANFRAVELIFPNHVFRIPAGENPEQNA